MDEQRSIAEVCNVLATIGMHKYVPLIREEEIDMVAFLLMTGEDLLDIGVSDQCDNDAMVNLIGLLS